MGNTLHLAVPWNAPPAPNGWAVAEIRRDGGLYKNWRKNLTAILSCEIAGGKRWLHLSVSHRDRVPNWQELREAKGAFLGDVYAYQVIPPKAQYVNIDPRVLHLFHCLDGPVMPEFSDMVGGRRVL